MKKIFLLIPLSGLFFVSCKHFKDHVEKQQQTLVDSTANPQTDTASKKKRYNLAELNSLDPAMVKLYSDNYKALVKENADNAVLIMNTSGLCDAELGNLADRISFIYGAGADKKVTMIMEFYFEASNSSKYYLYSDFLNGRDPGMGGRPVLCPPPTPCDIGSFVSKAK